MSDPARPFLRRTLDRLGALELTPEEFLEASRYIACRVRWPAGHHWVLEADEPTPPTVLAASLDTLAGRLEALTPGTLIPADALAADLRRILEADG